MTKTEVTAIAQLQQWAQQATNEGDQELFLSAITAAVKQIDERRKKQPGITPYLRTASHYSS
jgi:hypothetical protein